MTSSVGRHRPGVARAFALAALLGLLVVGPAAAAEPPADVVLDGVVTVRFVDEGNGGAPLADATVTLEASRPAVDPAAFQTLDGQTDANGTVVFSGVARPADGADPVTLDVSASRSAPNGCGGVETYEGSASVASDVSVIVDLAASASSSCVVFPILGLVLDADEQPFAVDAASATITYPGAAAETVEVDVDDEGFFAILVEGWVGEGSTEVHLTVLGVARQVPGANDCVDTVAEVADVTWTLDTPEEPEPTIVTAQAVVMGSVCQGQGTPGAPGPTVTLPPTDVLTTAMGDGPDGRDGPMAALAMLFLVAFGATLSPTVGRRLSRRGS